MALTPPRDAALVGEGQDAAQPFLRHLADKGGQEHVAALNSGADLPAATPLVDQRAAVQLLDEALTAAAVQHSPEKQAKLDALRARLAALQCVGAAGGAAVPAAAAGDEEEERAPRSLGPPAGAGQRKLKFRELWEERFVLQLSHALEIFVSMGGETNALAALSAHPAVAEWVTAALEIQGLKYCKDPRPTSVNAFNTAPERRKRNFPHASRFLNHDSKKIVGMLALIETILEEMNGLAAARERGDAVTGIDGSSDVGGIFVGDELIIRTLRLVQERLLLAIQHDDPLVSKRAARLYAAVRALSKRMGDFHFGMNSFEAVARLLDNAGLESLMKELGRSDTVSRKTVSKAYQKAVDLLSRVFDARAVAVVVELIEHQRMPAPAVLFPGGVLDVRLFYDTMRIGLGDPARVSGMQHFWGWQILEEVAAAREILSSVAAKDCEALEVLARRAVPVMAQLHKSNYVLLLCEMLELDAFEAEGALAVWRARRCKNVESEDGHAVGIDEFVEFLMGELKPYARHFSIPTVQLLARTAFLGTALKRMFVDESTFGRTRPVRSATPPARLVDLAVMVRFLMRAGVTSCTEGEEWAVESSTMHALCARSGEIGRAVGHEGTVVEVSQEQAVALEVPGHRLPGMYKVVRAKALPGQHAAVLMRRVDE